MSLVSMLGPSPDWVVGVSALELCSRNCSWVENKTLNLYPWDAGTDSGITYTVRIVEVRGEIWQTISKSFFFFLSLLVGGLCIVNQLDDQPA